MHWHIPTNRAEQKNWLIQNLMRLEVDCERLWNALPIAQVHGESPGTDQEFISLSSSSSSSSSSSLDCDGEDAATFFDTSRVFTFTTSGIGGTHFSVNCSVHNGSKTLTYAGVSGGVHKWTQNPPVVARVIQIVPFNPGFPGVVCLEFTVNASLSARYEADMCDVLIPGTTNFILASSPFCTGWPASIAVTCT